MKSFCIVILAVAAVCSAADTYDPKHDTLDIDAVVNNPQTLKEFVDCFTDKIGCSPVTAGFKKDMPEAIQQGCAKCTPAQKHIAKVFFEAFKGKLSGEYEEYRQKYDPENKYLAPFIDSIAKY